jgi:hypothetical protein
VTVVAFKVSAGRVRRIWEIHNPGKLQPWRTASSPEGFHGGIVVAIADDPHRAEDPQASVVLGEDPRSELAAVVEL